VAEAAEGRKAKDRLAASTVRRGGFMPRRLGTTLHRLFAVAGGRRAALLARLKLDWPAVVGPELARVTRPERIARSGDTAVLHLRCASAVALELQHETPVLLERIARYIGRGMVDRIAIRQGPLPAPPAHRLPPAPEVDAGTESALTARLTGVRDPDLADALAGLGRAVLSQGKRTRR
jgi:hypothetical protein